MRVALQTDVGYMTTRNSGAFNLYKIKAVHELKERCNKRCLQITICFDFIAANGENILHASFHG
jgi:hypothetical protein